jgi:hypothetical protein
MDPEAKKFALTAIDAAAQAEVAKAFANAINCVVMNWGDNPKEFPVFKNALAVVLAGREKARQLVMDLELA